jgi:hypothetical protein
VAGGFALAGTALASAALAGTTPTKHVPATTVQGNVHPSDAQQVILAAFDKYEVVGGMSPDHGVKRSTTSSSTSSAIRAFRAK